MSQIEPDLVVKFADTTLTIAGGKATIASPSVRAPAEWVTICNLNCPERNTDQQNGGRQAQ